MAAPAAPPEGELYERVDFSHREIKIILGGLMMGMLLAALDQSIVATALPRIVSDLGGLDHLSWVVTAYLLTSTAMTPLWGKISDLYGRRIIFQLTIVIFLVGSALCGLSQNMFQLILFRAIQGIGGGGLMAIAMAIIGDVIPPRERGRYTGYFGAVFGVSSVAGPLLGGWLTDVISWRWVFYVNLPFGIAALVVTSIVLHLPTMERNPSIDYPGAAAIVAAVSSLLLYLNWAGGRYGWTAPVPLALIGLAILFTIVFIWIESRAEEPILPLRLFRNQIFTIANIFGFLIGFAMFGGLIFLPLYFQTVQAMSPTESGLAMLPMVAGSFSMSILAGNLMTSTGRYKIFPIVGSSILIGALVLMSTIAVDTPYWQVGIYAFFFGVGLGLAMMTIVTPVQNAVEMRDMGVATSATSFGRTLGASIGTALFGAILGTRLSGYLSSSIGDIPADLNVNDVTAILALPEPLKTEVLTAYSSAVSDVFLFAVPIIVIALVIILFIKEIPLRTRRLAPEPTAEEPTATTPPSTPVRPLTIEPEGQHDG